MPEASGFSSWVPESVDIFTEAIARGSSRRSHLRVSGTIMWKSIFLAIGIFATLLGIELLFIDSAIVVPLAGGMGRSITAPEWAPWLLISSGAITILNLCTLPSGLIKE
mgnify:FL=1